MPPVEALKILKNAIEKINRKMKFLTVLGEHDMPRSRAMVPHSLFDLKILGLRTLGSVEIDGVLFAGISNLRGMYSKQLLEELKKFDSIAGKYKKSVLVLHQAIKRFLPFEGAYQLELTDLPRSANYYALGHIHARTYERFGQGYLAYSGSTDIITKDEISSWKDRGKGLYLVDLDEDTVVQPIDLNLRPQEKVEITPDEIDSLSKYKQCPIPPVLNITVTGKSLDKTAILTKIGKILSENVLRVRTIFRSPESKGIDIKKTQLDLKKAFIDYYKNNGLDDLSELAYELYEVLNDKGLKAAIQVGKNYLEEI